MYKIAISVLITVCASANVSAQGTSSAAKGTLPSPQDSKPLSAEPVTGSEDHKVKDKLTNSAFVEKSAMLEMTALAASRMASRKGATKANRDFAATMVESLETANGQLRAAATRSGTAMLEKPNRAHTEAISKLTVLSGVDFDQSYIGLIRQHLDAMVSLFENAVSEQSLSEELRNFAKNTVDMLRNQQLLAHNLVAN